MPGGNDNGLSNRIRRVCALPDPFNHATHVAPGNMRKRDRVIGYPLTDPNIQMIERTGFDPDQDFPGLGNR